MHKVAAVLLPLWVGCSGGGGQAPGPVEPVPVVAPPVDAAPPSDAEQCKAGVVPACDRIAELWSERQIVVGDLADQGRADAAVLHVACDDKDISSACMGLALMYKYGSATGAPDKATSDKYWARVAELGDLNGFRGADPSDAGAKALVQAEAECDQGRARACDQAGWAAYGAVQRDKSVKDAQAFYAKGCAAGSGEGCHWAGHFAERYPEEVGPEVAAQAEALLRKGCEQLKSIGACDELGVYLQRKGRADEALPLFDQACEEGARTACMHLAFGLLQKSCDAGEKKACETLAARPEEPQP